MLVVREVDECNSALLVLVFSSYLLFRGFLEEDEEEDEAWMKEETMHVLEERLRTFCTTHRNEDRFGKWMMSPSTYRAEKFVILRL